MGKLLMLIVLYVLILVCANSSIDVEYGEQHIVLFSACCEY
jgi:hypothetical protein